MEMRLQTDGYSNWNSSTLWKTPPYGWVLFISTNSSTWPILTLYTGPFCTPYIGWLRWYLPQIVWAATGIPHLRVEYKYDSKQSVSIIVGLTKMHCGIAILHCRIEIIHNRTEKKMQCVIKNEFCDWNTASKECNVGLVSFSKMHHFGDQQYTVCMVVINQTGIKQIYTGRNEAYISKCNTHPQFLSKMTTRNMYWKWIDHTCMIFYIYSHKHDLLHL